MKVNRIFWNGTHVETVFTASEQVDALKYWQGVGGKIEVKPHPAIHDLFKKVKNES